VIHDHLGERQVIPSGDVGHDGEVRVTNTLKYLVGCHSTGGVHVTLDACQKGSWVFIRRGLAAIVPGVSEELAINVMHGDRRRSLVDQWLEFFGPECWGS
jgi:hypothetical protein